MVNSRRNNFLKGACLAGAVLIPALGCSADPASNPLCCSEFKVGGDQKALAATLNVDASIAGEFNAFAQAVSDVSVTAAAILDEVSISCGNIASDLGADAAKVREAQALKPAERVKALCDLATATLQANAAIKAAGTLTVQYQPPKCEASFDAKAGCEANCKVDANCNIDATPPKCTGGELSVSCQGECSGSCEGTVEAAANCEGKCSATCEGSCVATGGVAVDCDGQCDGNCTGECSGTLAGGKCSGTCKGKCDATCTARAGAKVTCNGTCNGSCTGKCELAANAKIKCDGQCKGSCTGKATAPKCEGGKFESNCEVKGDCKANCDASVSARAECRPPAVAVVASAKVSADLQLQLDTAINSLEANLPALIVAVKARGEAFLGSVNAIAGGGAKIVASRKLSAKGGLCIGTVMAPAVGEAVVAAKAGIESATKLTAVVKI